LNKIIALDFTDSDYDRAALLTGNCFESKAEAERELERRKIEAVFRKHAVKKPLLSPGAKFYHIACIHDDLPFSPCTLNVSSTKVIDFGTPLFETKKDAYDAIEEAGGDDHIMKYYFSGV
jgi:hypothetical protein